MMHTKKAPKHHTKKAAPKHHTKKAAPKSKINTKKIAVTAQKRNFRVAVAGAAGGIGQPLSLLLKTNYTGLVTSLAVFDVSPMAHGVAADLSHIPTSVHVDSYSGDNADEAFKNADIIVVPAGVPRKPGMTRDDLFNTNAGINRKLAKSMAKSAPNAMALIISNPVNSMVPIWAETLKQEGVYNPAKLIGVTSLDVYRANTFASNIKGATFVPVIGGHAGTTIVPLFSLASQPLELEGETLDKITNRVMFGGDEVVQAKGGAGSATLSMASAGARFVESALIGLTGRLVSNEVGYVENAPAMEAFGTRFFSSEIDLNASGVVAVKPTWERANEYEQVLIKAMVPDLVKQIQKGIDFANQPEEKQ